MAENENGKVDPMEENDILKKLRAIGTDLWGESAMAMEGQGTEDATAKKPAARKKTPAVNRKKADIDNLWVTADETIDWTDALSHSTPTDGLTGPKMWAFYHKHAEKVLSGDLAAYTEVLQKANPLGELTDFAEHISMRAVTEAQLESVFVCKEDLLEKNRKLYLSAMGLRIARDLLACLPVEEVVVKGTFEDKDVFTVTYPRQQLLHRNFMFVDPVAFSEELGVIYG